MLQIECITLRLQGITLILKYVKSELLQSISLDLLKLKELTHYIIFVADNATPNALTIDIIKKATKNQNQKLLHQVIKLTRRNNCCKLNRPLTLLSYTENRNTFKHFLKTDSKLTIDDDLVLKTNRVVIPSEIQVIHVQINHFIPLAH